MFEDVDAICPYFRRASKDRIRCEGMLPNSTTEVAFSRKFQAEKYKTSMCDTFAYKTCPYALMIDGKYEKEGRA